jgi:glycosyltransferase involved in cell wall biosynthesis
MRLMIYSPLNLRFGGGFETSLMELMPRLHKLGLDMCVVTTDYSANQFRNSPSTILDLLEKCDCELVELQSFPLFLGSPPSPIPRLRSYNSLKRAAIGCDLIYFNNAYAFHDVILSLLRKIVRRPVISSYHAVLFCGEKIHDTYIDCVTRRLCRNFEAHHVLNKKDYARVKKWGAKHVFLIPEGVDTQKFRPPSVMERKKKMRILFVGRMAHQKGIDILCKIIRMANEHKDFQEEVEFVVVGSGPQSRLVEDISGKSQNVFYKGALYGEPLQKTYTSSDLFVMPSRFETLGVVALEAQSSGLPVVATDITGPDEIILHQKTGMLVSQLDPKLFFESIKMFHEMWRDRYEEFAKVRRNCRENAVKRYDWDVTAKRFALMVSEISKLSKT